MIDGLGAYLHAVAAEGDRNSELIATILTETLIALTAKLLNGDALPDAGDLKREHFALAIEGRHYSRFGDALSPVIRDVLGPNVPRSVVAAWGDAFWAIVRSVQAAEAAGAPRSARPGGNSILRQGLAR